MKTTISLSPENRHALREWYYSILGKDFSYIAVMTRRCSNLLETFLQNDAELRAVSGKVLTEQGLLLKANEIVETYQKNGDIPTIAILDELVVHGRAIGSFLKCFFNLLLWKIKQRGIEVDQKEFWARFYKSIYIYTFFENAAPMILREEYQQHLFYTQVGVSSEWRSFSLGAASEILSNGVVNSSYILSASTAKPQLPNGGKLEEGWICVQGADDLSTSSERLYLSKSADPSAYCLPCVRVYERAGKTFFVPYFFAKQIDIQTGCNILKSLQQQQARSSVADTLKLLSILAKECSESEEICVSFFQLLELLLSQVTLNQFLTEWGFERTETGAWENLCFDTVKISRNFGLTYQEHKIDDLFARLVSVPWESTLLSSLVKLLSGSAEAETENKPLLPDQDKAIHDALCKKLYKMAANHEQQAQNLEKKFLMNNDTNVDSLDQSEQISFESMIISVLQEAAVVKENLYADAVFLLYLTERMDMGEAALKICGQQAENGDLIGASVVQTTENSLSIVPRLIGDYFEILYERMIFLSPEKISKKLREDFSAKTPAQRNTIDWMHFLLAEACEYPELVNAIFNWQPLFSDEPGSM